MFIIIANELENKKKYIPPLMKNPFLFFPLISCKIYTWQLIMLLVFKENFKNRDNW